MIFIEFILKKILKYFIVLSLPLFLFVRGSTWLYLSKGFPTWPALITSLVATLGVLTLYGLILDYKINGKIRFQFILINTALPLALFYGIYGLFYLSDNNSKTSEIKSYYLKIHPLMRTAIATAILFDRKLLLTETKREKKDYQKMKLPIKKRSMHYSQHDGHVHAIDVRTIGRPEWKNFMIKIYFQMMGFKVLRHVGNADHLHISLPIPNKKMISYPFFRFFTNEK